MTVTNVTPPTISGTAQQGQTLSSSQGTWTFSLDYLTYDYQWERCDAAGANCVSIGGATSSAYTINAGDVGHTLRVGVTATEHSSTPPSGTALDSFSDFSGAVGPDIIFVNRWQNDGTNAMQSRFQTSPPWPAPVSGPGVNEVSTPYGGGFQMISDASMTVASGGKKSQIVDLPTVSTYVNHVLTANVMFPSSNTGFAAYNAWNDIFDFHNAGDNCYLGVNGDSGFAPVPSFYFRFNGPSWSDHVSVGSTFSLNTWYEFVFTYRFASDSSGYMRVSIDGNQFYSRSGPTLSSSSQVPYLQFGYYGAAQYYNEVRIGGMTISP